MDLETMVKATKKAKKQLKKYGITAKNVVISPELYMKITGKPVIKCGEINGMGLYVSLEMNDETVITTGDDVEKFSLADCFTEKALPTNEEFE